MRGFYIICLSFVSVINVFAQVGVNTNEPTETLDINGTLRIREINNGTTLATKDSILVVSGKGIVHKVSAAAIVAEGGNSPGNVSVLTDGSIITGTGTASQKITLGQNGATTNQILRWNGTTWVTSNDILSTLVKNTDGTYTYRSENDNETIIDLSGYLDNTDNQALTDLSINTSNVLSLSLEDGGTKTLDLSSLNNSGSDDQQLSLTGNNLALEDGGTAIDLSGYLDNTDDQAISSSVVTANESVKISLEDGGETTIDIKDGDSDSSNEIQDLIYNSTTHKLKVTNNTSATEIDLSSLNNSGSDDQQLSLTGNNLALEDGGTAIDLSGYLDNTDDQAISSSVVTANESVKISLEDGGETTIDIKDGDSDSSNEIQDLIYNSTTHKLKVTNNTSATEIDLSGLTDTKNEQSITYKSTDDKVQLLNNDSSVNSSVSRSDIDKQTIDTFEISGNAINMKIENATQKSLNLSATTPTDGQTLTWNNTDSQWEAQSTFLQTTAEIYDVAGGQTLNESSFTDINFATGGIIDTSDFSNSTNSITVSKTGRYEITYRVSTAVPTTVNNRTGGEFYLEVAGSESPGTRAYSYHRNRLVDKNTVTVNKVIEVTSTPAVIKVKGKVYASSQNGTTSSLQTVANGSSLIVKKIK